MSDWDDSDTESKPTTAPVVPRKTKWEGEDEEEDEPASDWEESSEEEEEKPTPAPVAPPKKKGTLKQKLAEKEAEKARKQAAGEDDDEDEYDSDDVLDPKEKAKRDKERQLQSDLNNAAELFGAAALGGTSSKELDYLISCQPRTKEDFQDFSTKIIEYIIKRHQNKPLYHTFVEHHVRDLAGPLKDVEVRKAASGLTTLANEKQKEQRDKAAGGKKKSKAAVKPALGSAKVSNKVDTTMYDEALDDFGNDPNDFM